MGLNLASGGAELSITANLALGLLLGAVIGFERQWRQRHAGLTTHALVAVGAAPASAHHPPAAPEVQEIASFAAPDCEGGCGSGSTVGPDGALYVTDGKAGRVLRVNPWTGATSDFATGLPVARSLREQIDWPRVRRETKKSPYAEAFLILLDRLDVVPLPDGEQALAAN